MGDRKPKFNISNSWKEYEQRLEHANEKELFFNKEDTFNEIKSSQLDDSGYEYGSMLEENNPSFLQSNPSTANVHPIRYNNEVRGSRTNIRDEESFKSKSKSNRNLDNKHTKQPVSYKERSDQNLSKPHTSMIKSSSELSEKERLGIKKPGLDKTKPNSSSSSQIKANKSAVPVDRSTCAQKPKPNNQRPQVEPKDDDSEIYEGEERSIKASSFDDEDIEYEEVEEVYQSINTSSIPPVDPIQEALSEEESSNEMPKEKSKIKNYKHQALKTSPKDEFDLKRYLNNNMKHGQKRNQGLQNPQINSSKFIVTISSLESLRIGKKLT